MYAKATITIENNECGISLGSGTSASLNSTIIRYNTGFGIELGGTSSVGFHEDTVQIIGNTGKAVVCGPVGQLDDVGSMGFHYVQYQTSDPFQFDSRRYTYSDRTKET